MEYKIQVAEIGRERERDIDRETEFQDQQGDPSLYS
jgi:hypothetical protein